METQRRYIDLQAIFNKLVAIEGRLTKIQSLQEKEITPWHTTAETATYLRCSISKVEDLTNAGLLPFRRLDPRAARSPRLYHRKELAAYLICGRNPQTSKLSVSEKREVESLC